MTRTFAAILLLSACSTAQAGLMRITEYMYGGNGPEFVEFCNVGASDVDMTGWSYDDDRRIPGVLDLSLFGTVVPGECVIITEGTAGAFNVAWGLGGTVKIIGGYTNNLGRNDEINLYDQDDDLVDRLTYGDQAFPGSIRAQIQSGWVSAAGLGANDPFEWTLSTAGDFQNSWVSTADDIGSPGRHVIPEPTTLAFLTLCGLAIVRRRRR